MASKRSKLMVDLCKQAENVTQNGGVQQDSHGIATNSIKMVESRTYSPKIIKPSINTLEEANPILQDVPNATTTAMHFMKGGFSTFQNIPMATTSYFMDGRPSTSHETLPPLSNKGPSCGDDDYEDVDDSDRDRDYAPESESSDSDMNLKQLASKMKKKGLAAEMGLASQIGNNHLKNRRGPKSVKKETREKRRIRKLNRNLGKEYITSKGKNIRSRERKPLVACRKGCSSKVDDETLNLLFTDFWSLGDFNERVAYTASLITKQSKKTAITSERKKKRDCVNIYHLKCHGKLIEVCKSCFEKCFDISNKFITTVVSKMSPTGICAKDQRGHKEPPNKIDVHRRQLVKDHIASIPSYESHYCRKKSDKKFLPAYYTLTRLYMEYQIWIVPNPPVSRKLYELIFHDMGIKIKKFQKDTCSTCEKLNILIRNQKHSEALNGLKTELQSHLEKAGEAYDAKREDKLIANNDKTKLLYVFDLQQCLPTPDLTASVAFYKRKLWTYNLTMHRCDTNQAICYMWYETVSGRGANQVASSVFKELMSLPSEIKHVTLYSDTCGGQNKNSHVVAMFLVLMQLSHLEYVDHKFLVPGHTHMECDSDHSVIERKKKKYDIPISHPRDWFQLVRLCGNVNNKFKVIEMKNEDFYNFSDLLKKIFQVKKKDEEGNPFIWKNVKWLRFQKQHGTFLYKTSLSQDAPFHKVNFSRRGQIKIMPITEIPTCLFPNPITEEKKKNLIDLLPYIDEVFHDFYKNLPTQKDLQEILPDIEELDEDQIE